MDLRLGDAMAQPRDDRQKELFRPALDQIIDMGHPLARLYASGLSRDGQNEAT